MRPAARPRPARCRRCCRPLLALALLAAASCLAAASGTSGSAAQQLARFVVSLDSDAPQDRRQVLQRLEREGYHVLQQGPGFVAVAHPTAPTSEAAAAAAASSSWPGGIGHRRRRLQQQQAAASEAAAAVHAAHVARLGALPGVAGSEADLRRHLHVRPSAAQQPAQQRRRLAAAEAASGAGAAAAGDAARQRMAAQWSHVSPRAYEAWGADVVDAMCASRDVRLSDEPGGEVLPWGVKAIGATDEALQAAPARGRAIVCVIDSGLWMGHPEYRDAAASAGMALSGCSPSNACPFTWSQDVVGHGTHVAGTVGAPRNGLGVVGVMPRGAELHVVRVWNSTGDVSQGQVRVCVPRVSLARARTRVCARPPRQRGPERVEARRAT